MAMPVSKKRPLVVRLARAFVRLIRCFRSALTASGSSMTPPAVALNQMLDGHRMTQSIYVAAKLGIADMLRDGPKRCEDLAAATGVHPGALYRFLRHLASQGIFTTDNQGRFALTPLAEPLRADIPGSVRARALLVGEVWERVYEGLLYSVRTGNPAFDHVFGMREYDYFVQNADAGKNYDAALSTWTKEVAETITGAYDFSGFERIVDVGGGQGALLAAILKAHPGARGILFDLPTVLQRARERLRAEGVAERCELAGGDFFESLPGDGDSYIFKWIFVDWDDEHAVAILKNCRRAIRQRGKLLVVDPLMPPGNVPAPATLDIQMLLLNGGRARSEAEYRSLLASAGFKVARIIPVQSTAQYSIIEGVPT